MYSIWIFVLFLGFHTTRLQARTKTFRVAGLFESGQEALELSFNYAISKMNVHNVMGSDRTILPYVEMTPALDSFEANKRVCRHMKEGIAAVFAPISEIPRAHIQSICNAFEIPNIQVHWDSRTERDYFSVSVYPEADILSKAFADLLEYWEWKTFTVIYKDNESLIRLQDILKTSKGDNYKVTVRKLESVGKSFDTMMKEIKRNMEYKMVIDCDWEQIPYILQQAEEFGMMSEYYHYHFISLDLPLVDLDPYRYTRVNITSMRLIDPTRDEVSGVMAEWIITEANTGKSPLQGQRAIATETALMYDAVHLFARAMGQLSVADDIDTQSLSCNRKDTWDKGNSILNYMKMMRFNGMSGRIQFNRGKRTDVELDIMEFSKKGLMKIGSWRPETGVNITTTYKEQHLQDVREQLKNKTLRVVTIYDPPYVMLRDEPDENGTMHEGFIIDLLDALKEILGFKYEIYEQEQRGYGSEKEDGTWNGMVGDLMERDPDRRADLAAAGMTITYARAQVVDFTAPFLNLGITIIYKKPSKTEPKLFSFTDPLSIDVWIYMMAAYLCVSFMLFIIARFSPYEWENPHPCDVDSDEVENQFTILNSLWFTIGALMQQGSEIAPKSISTRTVAIVWWFFTLIIISSYTANLAAFLTTKRMTAPITNADDLSKQIKIPYGTLDSGSTKKFFETSNVTTYKRMWAFMNANFDRVMVESNQAGFDRVKNSDYAFLAESTTGDYQVQRNCELMQIGDLLDNKGYGLATPKDSPYVDLISQQIIHLQESQKIQLLYLKWWKEKSGTKCPDEDDDKKNSNALDIKSVGGVFVLCVGGSVLGLIVAILEFLWNTSKNAKEDRQSFWSEMVEELRFIMKCKTTRSFRHDGSKDNIDDGVLTFTDKQNNKL